MGDKITLTKRNYLGKGWVHLFINNKTGEEVIVPCTEEEYHALNVPNPVNPTMDGHTWNSSWGGTIKVDTPNTILGDNEYCDFEDKYAVASKNEKGYLMYAKLEKSEVVDHEVAEAVLKEVIIPD